MVSLLAVGMKSLGETLGHQGWNSAKVVKAFDTHGTRKFAHRDPEPKEKVVEDIRLNVLVEVPSVKACLTHPRTPCAHTALELHRTTLTKPK